MYNVHTLLVINHHVSYAKICEPYLRLLFLLLFLVTGKELLRGEGLLRGDGLLIVDTVVAPPLLVLPRPLPLPGCTDTPPPPLLPRL